MKPYYLGLDIQVSRACSYAVIDERGTLIDSGWLLEPEKQAEVLINKFNATALVQVGIDAPRMPLIGKRAWYWSGIKRRWKRRSNQRGYGRHCEIVISAHHLANPQWTPTEEHAPSWMQLGFKLYSILSDIAQVHEVFPSASYSVLHGVKDVQLKIDFSSCKPGPKDMLDAWVAAATVKEYVAEMGCEVGGGDGLGTIILPRPIPEPVIEEVLEWPSS